MMLHCKHASMSLGKEGRGRLGLEVVQRHSGRVAQLGLAKAFHGAPSVHFNASDAIAFGCST